MTRIPTEETDLPVRIRAARKARGMTLAALAADTGYSVTYLSDIQRGRTRPSVKALRAIAEALVTTPAELMMDHGDRIYRQAAVLAIAAVEVLQDATFFGHGADLPPEHPYNRAVEKLSRASRDADLSVADMHWIKKLAGQPDQDDENTHPCDEDGVGGAGAG